MQLAPGGLDCLDHQEHLQIGLELEHIVLVVHQVLLEVDVVHQVLLEMEVVYQVLLEVEVFHQVPLEVEVLHEILLGVDMFYLILHYPLNPLPFLYHTICRNRSGLPSKNFHNL